MKWIAYDCNVYGIFIAFSIWKILEISRGFSTLCRRWHELIEVAPLSCSAAQLGFPRDRPPPQGVEVARARPQRLVVKLLGLLGLLRLLGNLVLLVAYL